MIACEIINRMMQDQRFVEIAETAIPVNPETIYDAEFLVRQDGMIVNVDGYYHPKGHILGEVLYAPDDNGNKEIFGQRYRKVTLHPGTYEPVAYPDRGGILGELDPQLNQTSKNPFFARYKQILPISDFIAHLPSRNGLARAIAKTGVDHEKFHRNFENLMMLLGLKPEALTLGVTGAALLGNTEHFHDLDTVFRGDVEENLRIAKKMRDLAIHEPKRRLFEGGKAWQIRFYNDLDTIMCNFFTYPETEIAPLHEFLMTEIESDIHLEGIVSDDVHGLYTPTILGLKDVAVFKGAQLIQRFTDLPLVAYHTASRGDCFEGDVVSATGSLVEISPKDRDPYLAACVIDREGVRNLTPPWKGYYAESR